MAMTPEQQAQLMALSGTGDREALLRHQIQQAEALRGETGRRYSTGAGALFGGIGDVVKTFAGVGKANEAKAGLEAIGKQRTDARTAYAAQLAALRGGEAQAQQNNEQAQAGAMLGMVPGLPSLDGAVGKPRTQADLMTEALRGRQEVADIGMMSGDPVLGQMGNALRDDIRTEQRGRTETAAQAAARAHAEAMANAQRGFMGGENDKDRALEREKMGVGRTAAEAKAKIDATERVTKDTTNLRKEYLALAPIKAAQDVAVSVAGAKTALTKANPTPVDDMNAIYSLMKSFDPSTGVKEGEYASASQTTGLPGILVNYYNKAQSGNLLNATQRADMLRTMNDMLAARVKAAVPLDRHYRAQAERMGLNPVEVFPDLGFTASPAEPAAGGLTPEQQARLDELRQKKARGEL